MRESFIPELGFINDNYCKANFINKMEYLMKFNDRLDNAGITNEQIKYYWKTFVKGHHRNWQRRKFDSVWWFCKRKNGAIIPLSKYTVIRHLLGEYWIAKEMAGKTDYFVIDLDFDSENPLGNRYDVITKIFPNPIPLRSSESGGIHLYYFLDWMYWKTEIPKMIMGLLTKNGISLSPGFIELFPGTINHLRLPLGMDSVILAPKTLLPLNLSLSESIEYIREFSTMNKINLYGL